MMSRWLLSLTDDDITTAIAAVHDSRIYQDLEKGNPELLALCYDSEMFKQAMHLMRCKFVRTLAILSWNETADV